jgi:hypothetical protein
MLSISFRQYFSNPQIRLHEGGNVRVTDVAGNEVGADKINLQNISRSYVRTRLLEFFRALNDLHKKQYKQKIWNSEADLESGYVFNGSSEHFFNVKISDDEFVKYKRKVGDVDITVPKDKRETVFALLMSLNGKQMTKNVTFVGSKQRELGKSHECNSLVNIDGKINVQIDFEFLEYHEDRPSEFAKFSHSSVWEDIKAGYKGVIHKYLLQSLIAYTGMLKTSDITFFTPKATAEKPRIKALDNEKLATKSFSITKGRRTKVGPYMVGGKQYEYEGKPVYKEIPREESEYTTKPLEIAKEIFGQNFQESELPKVSSFLGLIELSKKYLSPQERLEVMGDFFIRLFGKGAQGFERNNPTADYDVKRAGYEKVKKEFNLSSFPELPGTLEEIQNISDTPSTNPYILKIKDYYTNYKFTEEIPA